MSWLLLLLLTISVPILMIGIFFLTFLNFIVENFGSLFTFPLLGAIFVLNLLEGVNFRSENLLELFHMKQ